jgi:YD repeat-containing protein
VLGEDRAVSLQRDFITRRDQAIAHAAEYLRTAGKPKMTASMSGRREKTRLVRPGDYIRYDIDLEPGGDQLLQYFKVISRSIPRHGPIGFEIEADESLAPIPYTPGTTPVPETPIGVDEISYQRIFEASVKLAGVASQVMVLAERPSSLISGFHLHYDSDTNGVFQRLGTQTGFATRATLHTDLTDSATTVSIDVPAQVDTDRLTEQPGDLGAADDQLLAIILPITAGYIDEDSDGYAKVEICSVSAQALVSGSNYNLTVLRARQGTIARAFTHGASCEVWLISRAALIAFSHGDFETLRTNRILGDTPDTAYFRLQPFNYVSTRDLGDCSSVAFRMPLKAQSAPALTLTLPASNPLTTSTSYPVLVTFSGTWEDLDSDITSYQIAVSFNGGDENIVLEESVAPTGSIDFSTTVAVDQAGTYVVRLTAYDFAGNVTTYLQTLTAGAGTAKPAKPIFFHSGDQLVEYNTSGTPNDSLLSGYGTTGKITATTTTFGATVTYRWRAYDTLGSWTAFSGYSSTPVINSQRVLAVTNNYIYLQIQAKATRAGVDSDVATVTVAQLG